ncbi:septation protein SepH [Jatrophihabitans lederbergiae]|uniref:Septation protein SepH n=1 Tax=Jatrophihabitans lederbergiae TaxID=3075547 RepID=A0ABU2J950_9ACTN|nr:septation protein SepH [Jatrophihabitans sp. DSM 44399]MDT0260813.1 septation protein SepH [Jatrophihabitans sp. DSM 44399]
MRLLRLIGPSEDGTSLTLQAQDGGERFSIPIDAELRAACSTKPSGKAPVADAEPTQHTPTQHHNPSPREIQTRVRAGETAESIAEEADLPLERVMRFAYPVLQERTRVVDEARRARARRQDGRLEPFGELIDARLSRHGVEPPAVLWDAYRREDGGWTVTAMFTANEREMRVKFSFVLMNRTVSALDDVAADLFSDRPVRALLRPEPAPAPTSPPASPVPGEAPAEDAGPARLSAVPDEGAAAEPTPPVRAPGRRQKAFTRPVPVGLDDELFDQDAADQPWQNEPLPQDLSVAAAPNTSDEAAQPTANEQSPEGAAADGEPAGDEAAEPKRARRSGEKPRMPSWDDILLGVRHKSD